MRAPRALGPRDAKATVERTAALRNELARRRLDGFVVPKSDEHQGEWVPAGSERLAWLTGFTGSAGFAIVLTAQAAIFVDGRYTLQAAGQVDPAVFSCRHVTEAPVGEWLVANLRAGQVLGYDPWLHTAAEIDRLRAAADELAPGSNRCPAIRSTRCGPAGRHPRWPRWSPTRSALPASPQPTSAATSLPGLRANGSMRRF